MQMSSTDETFRRNMVISPVVAVQSAATDCIAVGRKEALPVPVTCSEYSRTKVGELGCRNAMCAGAAAGSCSCGGEMSVTTNCILKNRDVSKQKPFTVSSIYRHD